MPQETVEVVREMWKAYGDRGIDAALDYLAEDCVSEDFPELPDRAIYEGRKGFLDRYRQFADTWGDFVIKPVEFMDVGDGVVVAVCEMRGSGRDSGVPMMPRLPSSTRCATARSSAIAPLRRGARPSKPPGCRSRG